MTDKILMECERKLIASVIIDGKPAYKRAAKIVDESDFQDTMCSLIFGIAGALTAEGGNVDLLTISSYCKREDMISHLQHVGISAAEGRNKLDLAAMEISMIDTLGFNIESGAAYIHDEALRRKLIANHENSLSALKSGGDIYETLERERAEIMRTVTAVDKLKPLTTLTEAIEMAIEEMEQEKNGAVVRVPSPFPGLNDIFKGFEYGRLYGIAAEEKTGKSLLTSAFALHASENGIPTMIVSLEMKSSELARRFLSMQAGTSTMNSLNIEKVRTAGKRYEHLPLFIYDKSLALKSLTGAISAAINDKGVKLIVCDYLQLVQHNTRNGNRTDGVNEVVRTLKAIALDTNVSIILVASLLIKQIAGRGSKKPHPADVRDTGAFSFDCDCLMMLWQPFEDKPEYRELIVSRSRYSRTGEIAIYFDEEHLRFKPGAKIQGIPEQPYQYAREVF
jgi:replicative DNA helicase